MKILVLSDLHLDFAKFTPGVDPTIDLVILAGDISEGAQGMNWAHKTFLKQRVVYVAGNHEFYGHNIEEMSSHLRKLARASDIHYLERDSVEIGGVRFLGTTLWSDYELFGAEKQEESMSQASMYVNDFKCIRTSRDIAPSISDQVRLRAFTPADARDEFKQSAAWLEAELAAGDPARTVVVTHHAPHRFSIEPRFERDLLTGAFASDLTHLMGRSRYWIHGHMHSSSRYNVNGTEVIANPRGYMRRDGTMENSFFDPGLVIEI